MYTHAFQDSAALQPGTFSGILGGPVEDKAAFNNFPHAYGAVERTSSEHKASAFAGWPNFKCTQPSVSSEFGLSLSASTASRAS